MALRNRHFTLKTPSQNSEIQTFASNFQNTTSIFFNLDRNAVISTMMHSKIPPFHAQNLEFRLWSPASGFWPLKPEFNSH